MADEIAFGVLEAALANSAREPIAPGRLKVSVKPHPFIAPSFHASTRPTEAAFAAEVLIVEASAAVGKSTIASYLSSSLNIPLLDLAKIPVSTGSLKALLLDVSENRNILKDFHEGKVPIIVDALDEGRLLSGENGFESFLQTAGELLLENRSVTDRPKLIFFGRYESAELANIGLQLAGDGLSITKVEVGFFAKEAAWNLIEGYADLTAAPASAYRQHPGPVRELIAAYFEAIEMALGLERNSLWESSQGRAFAGYAPVLAAVGSLISQLDNFVEVSNRLRTAGTQEACGVIETVLKEIMSREQKKLGDKLSTQTTKPLPPEAYDMQEQLTLLMQFVHGQTLEGTGRVKLSGSDQAKYQSAIKLYIPEHPFVRQQEFGNAVLGSVIVANAILEDTFGRADLARTADLSRQPFLWRSLSHKLNGMLIDGRYLGFILNSFWSDPLKIKAPVTITSADVGSGRENIPIGDGESVTLLATTPLSLYAQVQECDTDVGAEVRIVGYGPRGSAAVFYARGPATLICDSMEVLADTIRFEGDVWFEANQVASSPRLELSVNGARVGWGGHLAASYPWNRVVPKLAAPYDRADGDRLLALIRECDRRTPPGGNVALNFDFTPVQDDPYTRWIGRQFSEEFPELVRLMIGSGLASSEAMVASGSERKVRVRFDVSWEDLVTALENPARSSKWQTFLDDARQQIG